MMRKPPSHADSPRSVKVMRIWRRHLREWLLTALLVIQIFILFVMPAARAAGLDVPHGAVYGILLAFVMLAIFLSRSRTATVMICISTMLTTLGIVWYNRQPGLSADSVSTAGQVLTQLSLLWVVTTAVFSPGRITYHRIMGAVVMYLCIGMIFTSLNMLLAQAIPNAFTHVPTDNNIGLREAMNYYSFGTLTTGNLGYIVPLHPIARSLANLESICGQLFPATLLARIVGLHGMATHHSAHPSNGEAVVRHADHGPESQTAKTRLRA